MEMAVTHVTDQSFTSEVEKEGLVLVDFWAPWCGPCKMIAPILDELDQTAGDKVTIVKSNVDENPETASKFGVMSIPTLILFKNGQPVDKIVGLKPLDALQNLINRHV
jgi:thioredoxin 1